MPVVAGRQVFSTLNNIYPKFLASRNQKNLSCFGATKTDFFVMPILCPYCLQQLRVVLVLALFHTNFSYVIFPDRQIEL